MKQEKPWNLHIPGAALDAELVLMDSAQVFHWVKTQSGLSAVCAGRAVTLMRSGEDWLLKGAAPSDAAFWKRYFDLERDYDGLKRQMEGLPMARRALELLPGMRVLNQPAWEALVAFILSANNNVKRIRSLVESISRSLGQPHAVDGAVLYEFPTPEALADAGEGFLRSLGCGYRAPYLADTARRVAEGFDLQALSGMEYETALKRLMELKGVGEKVADCVLLFGAGHGDAFPVDVWVERMMRAWFTPEVSGRHRIKLAGRALFGAQAGIIQQYLFHCARMGLMDLEQRVV